MQMIVRVLLAVVLGVASARAQTADGEITGRINDKSGAPLPGVRITITNGDQAKKAITDEDGRFGFRSLTMGTYRVAVELAEFTSISGDVALSSSMPRAWLGWSLAIGCFQTPPLRVSLTARQGAPLVDQILYVQVISADGAVLMSDRPECAGRVMLRYSVQVLGDAPARGRTSRGRIQIFMSANDVRLETGHQYVALLWPNGQATDDLVLPVVSGRIASPSERELNGLRVDDALKVLGKWSKERQR